MTLGTFDTMKKLQEEFCKANHYVCDVTGSNEKVGFAIRTLGAGPINGLRHRREGDTSGWYIWCGEFSQEHDFFSPLHANHLEQKCPEIIKLLGLPPGYRFLVAEDYLDIWFDESLIEDD